MSRSYIREDQMDPVVTSKVDVALRLALTLTRAFVGLLNELEVSRLACVETPTAGGLGMSLSQDLDLSNEARVGKTLIEELMAQTHALPEPLRVVECANCRRLWMGHDVMRWRDLETRADLATWDDHTVASCPECDMSVAAGNGLGSKERSLEYITLRFGQGDENDE